jgi:hypothetical protein
MHWPSGVSHLEDGVDNVSDSLEDAVPGSRDGVLVGLVLAVLGVLAEALGSGGSGAVGTSAILGNGVAALSSGSVVIDGGGGARISEISGRQVGRGCEEVC